MLKLNILNLLALFVVLNSAFTGYAMDPRVAEIFNTRFKNVFSDDRKDVEDRFDIHYKIVSAGCEACTLIGTQVAATAPKLCPDHTDEFRASNVKFYSIARNTRKKAYDELQAGYAADRAARVAKAAQLKAEEAAFEERERERAVKRAGESEISAPLSPKAIPLSPKAIAKKARLEKQLS